MSHVVAAIVQRGDRYLCMQRTRSRYPYISEHWEFPGGKAEEGENDYEALIREIKEEMDWDIFVGKQLGTIDYQYPDFKINLAAYLCRASDDDDFKMLEHLDYQWLTVDEFDQLMWTEADKKLIDAIKPLLSPIK